MPVACQPYKMSLWDKMKAYFCKYIKCKNCIAIKRPDDIKLYKKSKILVMI